MRMHVLKLLIWPRSFFVYVGIAWRFFFPRKKRSVVGEVALITGAGNGIGRDLALQVRISKNRIVTSLSKFITFILVPNYKLAVP